ncbi:MAG: DUF3667 domain-containing protein [Pseudomonadota bacterium]
MTDASAASPTSSPCRNCGTPMLGPHCYACGQPMRGLVRPLGNLFGDLMDSVFNLDLRVLRTLGPLFRRPGFLTQEYFAGRQVRYVTPVRLFFFLTILAFFMGRLTTAGEDAINLDSRGDNDAIASAVTEAEVTKARDTVLARLATSRKALPEGPGRAGAEAGFAAGEEAVRDTAEERIRQLREASEKGLPPPPPLDDGLTFGDRPWDANTNPLKVPGAPAFLNEWINEKIGRAKGNIKRIKADPELYKDAFMGAIPTALFVLVPAFALLLKLAYVFKRRIYMEHLVVALHSHAFISLSLLLVFALLGLQHLAVPDSLLQDLLGWCIGLLCAWIPVYLLLMQKRVYAQEWPMTLLKYGVLGTIYMVLLSFGIAAAAAASLVWM